MVKLCVPTSLEFGVHEKYPAELRFEFDAVEPLKESCAVKTGFEKPDAAIVKVTGFPTITVLPGESPWTVAPEPPTVIVCVAVAECPEPSCTVTVIVCDPISFEFGVHEKLPEELILLFEIVVPPKESLSEYDGFEKPDADARNVIVWPTFTFEPGESDCMTTVAAELTVMVSVAFALWPEESLTSIVMVCVPF